MAAKKFLRLVSGILTEVLGIQTSSGAGNAGDVAVLDDNGRFDSSMMPAGFGAETFTATASEALAAGDYINVWNSTGLKVRKADATNIAKKAHGYVLSAVSSSGTATVYYGNLNNQVTSKTVGANQFLSETTPGATQETAPTASGSIVQLLGVAKSATEILTEIEQPIQLA